MQCRTDWCWCFTEPSCRRRNPTRFLRVQVKYSFSFFKNLNLSSPSCSFTVITTLKLDSPGNSVAGKAVCPRADLMIWPSLHLSAKYKNSACYVATPNICKIDTRKSVGIILSSEDIFPSCFKDESIFCQCYSAPVFTPLERRCVIKPSKSIAPTGELQLLRASQCVGLLPFCHRRSLVSSDKCLCKYIDSGNGGFRCAL